MKILTLNCGSSSIKFKIFDMPDGSVLVKGQSDRIGKEDAIIKWEGQGITPLSIRKKLSDHREALKILLGQDAGGKERFPVSISDIAAVGHRVVHGGEFFQGGRGKHCMH